MKVLYVECSTGISGDMLNSALLSLFDNPNEILNLLKNAMPKNIELALEGVDSCGISGKHFSVKVNGIEEKVVDDNDGFEGGRYTVSDNANQHHHHQNSHHHGNSFDAIIDKISILDLPNDVKAKAAEVYLKIAQAESFVHGKQVNEIHFHEVGDGDAIADIVCACYLISLLKVDEIVFSPINTGKGSVKCAHGILPVPTPATAILLKGVPVYTNDLSGELCTPTGAALAVSFATKFSDMPTMIIDKIGYGVGSKTLSSLNAVRAFLGESNEKNCDEVSVISCNIDDMSGEAVSYATTKLIELGALDVYTQSIYMKKNRPAIMLSVICEVDREEFFAKKVLTHTTSLGVRIFKAKRLKLDRKLEKVLTPFGEITLKSSCGYGIEKSKFEFNELKKIADENDISLLKLQNIINSCKK